MRKQLTVLLALILTFSVVIAPSNAAVKAGTKCTKAGATSVFAGKKFTCVKTGTKLLWNKGVSVKAAAKPDLNPVFKPVQPTPTPVATPSPTPTPTPVATPTPTPTPTPVATPSPTPTPVATPSPTPSPTRTPDWVDPLFGKPCTKIYERIPNQIFELICMPHKDTNPGSTDTTLYWAQSNIPGNHKFPSPTPKPLVVNSYANPTVPTLAIDQCKMVEQSKVRNDLPTGFPRIKSRTPDMGTIKWALVPVDFVDLPGDKDFMSRIENEMKLASEWYEIVSEGKLKIEWVVAKDWITLPGVSTDYKIPYSEDITKSPEVAYFWKKAIPAADPYFDFTGIKTVNFILPKGQKIIPESGQGWPWDAGMKTNPTNEGTIDSFTILGAVFELPGTTYWQYWAHEFGHAIGIPHISQNRVWRQSPALDLMGNDNGPSKELSTWLRFVKGWLDDDRVYCQDKVSLKSTDVTLVPLNQSKPGIKMAVVKLSSTKALILESRRVTKFECVTESYREGVLAYIYDATLGHFEDFLVAVEPAGRPLEKTACRSPDTTDSLLRTGDKITFDGVTVEVIQHGTFDVVRISKTD